MKRTVVSKFGISADRKDDTKYTAQRRGHVLKVAKSARYESLKRSGLGRSQEKNHHIRMSSI